MFNAKHFLRKNVARFLMDHRLPKLKSRLFDVFLRALWAADSTYVVYATACVYREMYGKNFALILPFGFSDVLVTDLVPTVVTQRQVSGFILNSDWSIRSKSHADNTAVGARSVTSTSGKPNRQN